MPHVPIRMQVQHSLVFKCRIGLSDELLAGAGTIANFFADLEIMPHKTAEDALRYVFIVTIGPTALLLSLKKEFFF